MNFMVMEFTETKMATSMMENGLTVKDQESLISLDLTVQNLLESSGKIKCMEMVNGIFQMARYSVENIKMGLSVDMA